MTIRATATEISLDLQNLEVLKELLEPFRALGVLNALGSEEASVVDTL